MATKKKKKNSKPAAQTEKNGFPKYCSVPEVATREFPSGMNPGRMELIATLSKKWANGTTLKYFFFDKDTDGRNVKLTNGTTQWRGWKTTNAEKDVVRQAFSVWKAVGIGLNFQEVTSRDEAEIRIGFERGDGAWSFVGRDLIDLGLGPNERTMNFGWNLTQPGEIDTAIHEIGHTIDFEHEHQNPIAGIVWDEDAVYTALAQPPNSWKKDKTFNNIIKKIVVDTVQGSEWDPDSIMHYPFGPGLVKEPEQYRVNGISPAGGLSARDKTWVKTFYPPIAVNTVAELKTGESVKLKISPGEQRNFAFKPGATRNYEIGTFGTSDTVIVLSEDDGGQSRYVAGDDDSGEDRNAHLKVRLLAGKKYTLRVRLYYAEREDETAVMIW